MHYLCYALFGSEILDLCFWTRVYLLYYWNAFRAKNERVDRKSTRLNSSHSQISYAVFCLKKKTVHCSRAAAERSGGRFVDGGPREQRLAHHLRPDAHRRYRSLAGHLHRRETPEL